MKVKMVPGERMQCRKQDQKIHTRESLLARSTTTGRALIALHVVDGPVAAEGNCKDLKSQVKIGTALMVMVPLLLRHSVLCFLPGEHNFRAENLETESSSVQFLA